MCQIGKPDLNAFFFNVFLFLFFFFPCSDEQQTFQIWVGHNFVQYEIWNLIFGWTRYKTEHRVEDVGCSKCLIVSVMSFYLYFDKQGHKKLEKKSKQAKKLKAWILLNQTRTKKQTRGSFETYNLFFSALMNGENPHILAETFARFK